MLSVQYAVFSFQVFGGIANKPRRGLSDESDLSDRSELSDDTLTQLRPKGPQASSTVSGAWPAGSFISRPSGGFSFRGGAAAAKAPLRWNCKKANTAPASISPTKTLNRIQRPIPAPPALAARGGPLKIRPPPADATIEVSVASVLADFWSAGESSRAWTGMADPALMVINFSAPFCGAGEGLGAATTGWTVCAGV